MIIAYWTRAMMDEISRIELTDELDLHHFHPKDAKGIIADFLEHAKSQKYPAVRIVHGKGGSVMKSIVHAMLAQHAAVERFHDDAANWGATIVIMNKE